MDLKDCRLLLDQIDGEILRLFARRMEIARQIGEYKRQNGLPVLDEARERQKLASVAAQCPPEVRAEGTELFEKLMELSRREQEKGAL